jgi:Spy/CpxP family protein refolding chaperone
MKNKILTVAGATILGAGLMFAQTGSTPAPNPPATHGQGFHHRRPMFARMIGNLNLTDAQRTQAKSIFRGLRGQAQPIRTQLQQGRLALMSAAEAGQSADQLNQLAQANAAQAAQLAALRAQAFGKFYAILTPAQQQQVQTMQSKWAAHVSGQTANN